ncbi:MAG: trypsin-like peptidase domain-containing protein [Candidatus Shapirobacteria bacterium]|nr:trypsin-like peptidase domain-containing protein [Candidatus Shapirobacteria bacterium]
MDKKTLKGLLFGILIGGLMMGSVFLGTKLNKGTVSLVTNTQKQIIDEESTVVDVVQKATPSVVTVSMVKAVNQNSFGGMDFFGQFFGMPAQPSPSQNQNTTQDIGTGFIISADGLIVTNKHVVADTTAKYKVVIGKDQVLDVQNIYRDPVNDLAILKVNVTGLTPIVLGDSDKLKVGQTVIAIGTALGEFRSTVTRGVVSGLGRAITAGSPFQGSENLDNVIQTDAAINPGNSGGPLLNLSGEVIGVNAAVSQSGQNIGFALPINIVKISINNFKTTGEFDRPFLGVSYQMISKQAALLNDVPAGALVQSVVPGSSAEKAGIKAEDIITEIDGKKLIDAATTPLATYINNKKIGDTVDLKIFRNGKEIDLTVKLEKKQ